MGDVWDGGKAVLGRVGGPCMGWRTNRRPALEKQLHQSFTCVRVQIKPDWDGGSRGKVYNKGKRGKGVQ